MRLGLVPIFLVALLIAGCSCAEYIPPPEGEDAYCYRVVYKFDYSEAIFITDVSPEFDGDKTITLRQTWMAFDHDDNNPFVALRFDRVFKEITLDIQAGSVSVRQRCKEPII